MFRGSTTHGVLGGLDSLEVFGGMPVESCNLLSPGELLDHIAPQVNVMASSWKIAMSLGQRIGSSFESGVHINPFNWVVI